MNNSFVLSSHSVQIGTSKLNRYTKELDSIKKLRLLTHFTQCNENVIAQRSLTCWSHLPKTKEETVVSENEEKHLQCNVINAELPKNSIPEETFKIEQISSYVRKM